MNESDVIAEDFYWVWIDPSSRSFPDRPQVLVVAQAWRETVDNRLVWEGCGTDEGVHVISIVARVEPPNLPTNISHSTTTQ